MKVELKAIRMTDFKGIKETKETKFGKTTLVSGYNGSGKTTLQDAHLWLWVDKDSSMKSNPNIRPDDGRECIPTIEEEWDIDGTILKIVKMQKKKEGKPDENGIKKISLSNIYSINGVPKAERDFKKDLIERGFDFDNFLLLSHLDAFTEQKNADMRKSLFGMVSTKTDLEVARITNGCGDVAELLKSYKCEEIEAMNKASKKKADEQLSAIPNQIIGLEKAKVDIDTAELELQRNALNAQITELEKQALDFMGNSKEIDRLSDEIRELKAKASDFKYTANESLVNQRVELRAKISEFETQKRVLESDLRNAQYEFEKAKKDGEQQEKIRESILKEWEEETDKEFIWKEDSDICSFSEKPCEFIKSRNDEHRKRAEEDFNTHKKNTIQSIEERGNKSRELLKVAQDKKAETEKKISDIQQEIQAVSAEIERLNAELAKLPQEVDLSGNEEYQSLLSRVIGKEEKLKTISESASVFRESKESDLRSKREELSLVNKEIAKSENNVRIDEQIVELEEKKRDYAQTKADAEKILYQLSLVSRAKNEIMSDEINSHFDGIRWILYVYQKNGEYKEACIPEVYDSKKNEWKNMLETANTSLVMTGKIRIIEGFQRFYKQNLPVFVDFASELDKCTLSKIQSDRQLIFLKVTDTEFEVEEI